MNIIILIGHDNQQIKFRKSELPLALSIGARLAFKGYLCFIPISTGSLL